MNFEDHQMASPLAIGIDLGTTYCCLAVLRHHDHKPEIIPNEVGMNTSPSYVTYINEEDEEDEVFAGQTAKDLAYQNTETTVFDVKRLIGRTFYDSQIQRYNKLWPFHLVNFKGLIGVKIGEQILFPQDIVKELISHLLQTAQNVLGFPVESAVITVPAYFNDLQRGLTREACVNAGLKNVEFIKEPTAAAFAYSLQSSSTSSLQENQAKTCLIFDLGGGTFDLTFFKLGAGKRIEIIGIGGDARLGGDDFNELLTEYCIKSFEDTTGINLTADKNSPDLNLRSKATKILRRLRTECEKQKCFLSSTSTVVISLDGVHENKVLSVTVTREIFEELIACHLNRCMEILQNCLKVNGITKDEVDDVVLIGGSSRIPKVQEMVSDLFGSEKIRRSIDADEAVACGAAIHAYNIFTNRGLEDKTVTLVEMSENLDSYSSLDQSQFNADTMHHVVDGVLNKKRENDQNKSELKKKDVMKVQLPKVFTDNILSQPVPNSPRIIDALHNLDESAIKVQLNDPPLTFHSVHGKNIELSENGTIARRINWYRNAIVFTDRPIAVNEVVSIKLIEQTNESTFMLHFGFTNKNPQSFEHKLPTELFYVFKRPSNIWAEQLDVPKSVVLQNAVVNFHVDSDGAVQFNVDGRENGNFQLGIDTSVPLWAVMDVCSNTKGLELLSHICIQKSQYMGP